MKVHETGLRGILILEPSRIDDARGFFTESWNHKRMQGAGLNLNFVQDNQSLSLQAGTLRGLHFQAPPHAQAKLVSCIHGRLYDVAVDVRVGSPTYGQSFGIELSFENGLQLLIPAGFLHGFLTREPNTVISYKVTDYYDPDCDGTVHWDSCGIDWGLTQTPTLSEKDAAAPALADFVSPFACGML